MTEEEFETIVAEEFTQVPEKFKALLTNVALLIEDQPDEITRKEHGLHDHETLLGLYRGVPRTERGEGYGVGMTLPDTITIYRVPILEEAEELVRHDIHPVYSEVVFSRTVRTVVRDTLWHEIAHYFGMDEDGVGERERGGTNRYL